MFTFDRKTYDRLPPARSLSRTTTPGGLLAFMQSNIRYSEFTTLKSPEEVLQTKSGSCHDQTMFALNELRAMGYSPNALFVAELAMPSGHCGMTHSFVYYKKNGFICWFESSWGGYEGIRSFKSIKDIKQFFETQHKAGIFGDVKQYPFLQWGWFGIHTPGETLQEVVDKVW